MNIQFASFRISTIISDYLKPLTAESSEEETAYLDKISLFFTTYFHDRHPPFKDPVYLLKKKISRSFETCLSPKNIIDFLFNNHHLTFIKSVLEQSCINPSSIPERSLKTSCYYTALACSAVFLGLAKTNEFPPLFFPRLCCEVTFTIKKTRTITLTINNLFDGFNLAHSQKDPKFDALPINEKIKFIESVNKERGPSIYANYYKTKVTEALNSQLSSLDDSDEAISLSFEKALKSIDDTINLEVLNSLRIAIRQGALEVSPAKSYAYLVGICFSEVDNPLTTNFEHIFFIEQSFENEAVNYRLYQSMINYETYSQSSARVKPLTRKTVAGILEQLREAYCTRIWEPSRDIELAGYTLKGSVPRMMFNRKTNSLDGHRLAYYRYEFCPQKTLSNLMKLVNTSDSLKKELSE